MASLLMPTRKVCGRYVCHNVSVTADRTYYNRCTGSMIQNFMSIKTPRFQLRVRNVSGRNANFVAIRGPLHTVIHQRCLKIRWTKSAILLQGNIFLTFHCVKSLGAIEKYNNRSWWYFETSLRIDFTRDARYIPPGNESPQNPQNLQHPCC